MIKKFMKKRQIKKTIQNEMKVLQTQRNEVLNNLKIISQIHKNYIH